MANVFQENFNGTYDLVVNGRTREYEIDPDDLVHALRRARIPAGDEVYVEDESGYRERLKVRRS